MDTVINLNQIIDKTTLCVGVISDTHGQLNEHVIGSLENCDVILHAGDIGDASIIASLRKYTQHVFPVRGNNDINEKWPADDLAVLGKIPEAIELSFNDEVIAVTHGDQFSAVATRHQKLRELFPHANIIIYGHSHLLVCDQEEEPWVVNPGAGGYNRTFKGASCLVMRYENKKWAIEETRVEN